MSPLYRIAKERYASVGVDTDAVIENLKNVCVSIHCWQGDDVRGFDSEGELSGGIRLPEIIPEGRVHQRSL